MQNTYLIQKLVIELELDSEQEYRNISRYIEEHLLSFLLKELESTLSDHYQETEKHLVIEKLEVELEPLPFKELRSKQLILQIRSNLEQKLQVATINNEAGLQKGRIGRTKERLVRKEEAKKKDSPSLSSYRSSKLQSLKHYLLTGQFIFGVELSAAEITQFFEEEKKQKNLAGWVTSLSFPPQQYQVLKRLALQLPETQKSTFFSNSDIQSINESFEIPLQIVGGAKDAQKEESSSLKLKATKEKLPSVPKEQKLLNPEEGLYLNNAGIVIIAHYLPALFQKSGLLNDTRKAFKNEYAAFYALHLIEYLANKATIETENTALINKLLCGLPIEAPIATQITIEDTDKELATRLLLQVSQKWDIKTGEHIDFLRGSFFIRDGKLTRRDNYWLLTVETKVFDSHLLKKLPWSFKRIKLPWMPEWLQVDWY